jgi:Na+/H+-dicarboxylate symporter
MLRTSVNVTGDAAVSMIIAKSQNQLGDPKVKDWDDNYPENKEI